MDRHGNPFALATAAAAQKHSEAAAENLIARRRVRRLSVATKFAHGAAGSARGSSPGAPTPVHVCGGAPAEPRALSARQRSSHCEGWASACDDELVACRRRRERSAQLAGDLAACQRGPVPDRIVGGQPAARRFSADVVCSNTCLLQKAHPRAVAIDLLEGLRNGDREGARNAMGMRLSRVASGSAVPTSSSGAE